MTVLVASSPTTDSVCRTTLVKTPSTIDSVRRRDGHLVSPFSETSSGKQLTMEKTRKPTSGLSQILNFPNLLTIPDPLSALRDVSVAEKERRLARDMGHLLDHKCLHAENVDDKCPPLGFFGGFLVMLFLPTERRVSAMKGQAEAVQQLANFLLVSSAVLRGAQVTSSAPFNKNSVEDYHKFYLDNLELGLGIWNFTSMTVLLYAMMLAYHVKQAVCYDDARRASSSRPSSLVHDASLLRSLGKARFCQGLGLSMILLSTPASIFLLPGVWYIRCSLIVVWLSVFFILQYSTAQVLLETSPLSLRHYPYLHLLNPSGWLMRHVLISKDKLRHRAALQTRELLSHDLAQCEDTAFFLLRWCPQVLEAWAHEENAVVRAENDIDEVRCFSEDFLAKPKFHNLESKNDLGLDDEEAGFENYEPEEEENLLRGAKFIENVTEEPSLTGFLAEHAKGQTAVIAEEIIDMRNIAASEKQSTRNSMRYEGIN